MSDFISIIQTTIEPSVLKVFTSLALAFIFLFGDFHTQGVLSVMMLMLFDTVMGTMASWQEGKPITSRRFSRLLQKSIVYLMAISAGYFTDITIGWQVVQATMIGFIGVTEFISIIENAGRMGYHTPRKLLNQLKDFQSQK